MTHRKPDYKPTRGDNAKSLISGCSSMVEQQLPKRALLAELRYFPANSMLLQGNASSNLAVECKPDDHRCEALGLAFFAIMHTGELDDLTRAAIARCNEGTTL